MSNLVVETFSVIEDGDVYVMARLYKKDASHNLVVVASSDFSTISRTIMYQGTTVAGPTSLTPSAVIESALSTGTIWTKDTTGFNFINLVPASCFPDGGLTYECEYKLTFTSGVIAWIKVNLSTVAVAVS